MLIIFCYRLFILWEFLTPHFGAIRSTLVLYEVVFAIGLLTAAYLWPNERVLVVVLASSTASFFVIAVMKEPLVIHFNPGWNKKLMRTKAHSFPSR